MLYRSSEKQEILDAVYGGGLSSPPRAVPCWGRLKLLQEDQGDGLGEQEGAGPVPEALGSSGPTRAQPRLCSLQHSPSSLHNTDARRPVPLRRQNPWAHNLPFFRLTEYSAKMNSKSNVRINAGYFIIFLLYYNIKRGNIRQCDRRKQYYLLCTM